MGAEVAFQFRMFFFYYYCKIFGAQFYWWKQLNK
jgi:hypothetical protein